MTDANRNVRLKKENEQLMADNERLIQENKALQKELKKLGPELMRLSDQIATLTRKLYGRQTERTEAVIDKDQVTFLFDEAETEGDPKAKEPALDEAIAGYTRRKKQKGRREADLSAFPHQKVIHQLADSDRFCNRCGTLMQRIGETFVRSELVYVPPRLYVKDHYQESYECLACRKLERPHIEKAPLPDPVISHSFAAPSTVAWAMYQKYVNAMPLYRQEKEWEALGIPISRATLANWMILTARDHLIPLKDRMARTMKQEEVLHADETPVQVMGEDGRSNTATSYMWLYATGEHSDHPIRIFDYRPGRGGKYPRAFLKGFKGYLHTDAYAGYDQVPDITRCLCFAHLRRNFIDALPKDKAKRKGTLSEQAITYCNALFAAEREMKELSDEERRRKRLEQEKPILEEFWGWLEKTEPTVLPKSALGQAVSYALKHKEGFMAYLEDGRCSLSNNLAENAIRPFTIGRKNWLFSASPKGAEASAAIYSIIETAKANGLDPYLYLEYLFEHLPGLPINRRPELLDRLMPWMPKIQEACGKGKSRNSICE